MVGLQLICKLSDECEEDLRAIDAERSAIRTLIPSGLEHYFTRQARIFSTHGSVAIEGHKIEVEQAASIVEGATTAASEPERAVLDLAHAYDLAYQLNRDTAAPIDSGTIRSLNAVLQEHATGPGAASRGSYRRPSGPAYAVRANRGHGALIYEPPLADDVEELMAEFVSHLRRWRETRPGPVAAALAHFAVISIHPFENGNGQTARLLGDVVLDLTGWSANRMLSLNSAIHDSGESYFEVLRSTQGPRFKKRVDVSAFVAYHTRQLRRAAGQLRESAVGLTELMDELGRTTDFDRQTMLLLWYLAMIGPMSPSVFGSLIDESPEAAGKRLGEAADAGLVRLVGAGPAMRYDLTDQLWRRAQGIAGPPPLEIGR